MRNNGNQIFTIWYNQNLSPKYRLMLHASDFVKIEKCMRYLKFAIFYT